MLVVVSEIKMQQQQQQQQLRLEKYLQQTEKNHMFHSNKSGCTLIAGFSTTRNGSSSNSN